MRIQLQEVNLERIYNALKRRIKAIPHLMKWYQSKIGKENSEKLTFYHNKYRNQRCFLVANGPSLKKMDLGFLKNEISFGLNRIYLAYKDMGFKNDYLVSVNKLVLTQFEDDIKKLSIPKFLNWEVRDIYRDDKNAHFIYRSLFGAKFGKNMSKSVTPKSTVTYAALQIIYYMGFKEVIIIGMDHNFITKSKNKPNKTEVRNEDIDVNHFHPNYFPKGSKWETPDLISSEYFYAIARKEFEKDGRRIVDCTVDGKCQVFEKGNHFDFIS